MYSKLKISIISLLIDLQANRQEIYEGNSMNMCSQVSLGQNMTHAFLLLKWLSFKPEVDSRVIIQIDILSD